MDERRIKKLDDRSRDALYLALAGLITALGTLVLAFANRVAIHAN